MQYLYNSVVSRQSYNITSKEQLFELLKSGIINPYSTVYDMECQTCVLVDNIPEIEVWKILQSNRKIKRNKEEGSYMRLLYKLPDIKIKKVYLAATSLAVVVLAATAFLYNYSELEYNGIKTVFKSEAQKDDLLNAFAQIQRDYINKSEPEENAFNKESYGEHAVLLKRYASMVTNEIKSESQLRKLSAELQKQKLGTLLNTEDGFEIFQAKIKNLSMVFEQHYKERNAGRNELQNSIEKTDINEEDKKSIIRQMGSSDGSFDKVYSEYCLNEIELLAALNKQMEYLKENTNNYRIEENDRIVFYNDKALAEYTKIVQELEMRIKKEREYITKLNMMKEKIME